jgi:hypothetical protein
MTVTQYYKIKDIEYVAVLNFVLFVERPDLVPVTTYPFVYSPREAPMLVLDAS